MSDQPVAETSTWQHTTHTTDRRPCSLVGFEPHNLSRRPVADPRLRRRGHRDRQHIRKHTLCSNDRACL